MLLAVAERLELQKNLVTFQIDNIVSSGPKDTPCLSHNRSSMLSIQSCFRRVSEVPLQKVALAARRNGAFLFRRSVVYEKRWLFGKRYHQTVGQSSVAQDLCMWLKGTHVFLCGTVATFLS